MAKHLGLYLPEQLELKVTLSGSDPAIWRRLAVHSGLTLHDLHHVIQYAFDWDNSHLYQFFVPPGGKLTRKAFREAKRYHMLPPDPPFDYGEPMAGPADEIMIGHVFTAQCKQIVYEYDFGDGWQHVVKLVKRTPGGDPADVPQCLAGENAAPPDDSGGIYGYYDYVAAWEDPANEMHEQAMEWLGPKFDPAKFDLDKTNRRLAVAFKPVAKRPRKARGKWQ